MCLHYHNLDQFLDCSFLITGQIGLFIFPEGRDQPNTILIDKIELIFFFVAFAALCLV